MANTPSASWPLYLWAMCLRTAMPNWSPGVSSCSAFPVKHGAIGQSFPAFCRNSRSASLDTQRLPAVLFEFRAHPPAHQ